MAGRRATIALGATLAALAVVGGACSESEPTQVSVEAPLDRGPDDLPDGVTVSAEGEVTGAPDTMTVQIGVSVKRDTVQQAVDESATLATALLDAAKANGVAEDDLQTQEYSVNQEWRYPDDNPPVPDGFRVSNILVVKIRALDQAGATIDAMTAAGGDASTLQSVAFTLEEDDAAIDAAREDAMTKAKAKAEQLAELGGRTLGPAQAISDVAIASDSQTFATVGYAIDEAAGDRATPIQPGEVRSRVTVRVRYTLQ